MAPSFCVSDGEEILLVDFDSVETGVGPQGLAGAQTVRVEAHPDCRPAARRAPVSQMHSDGTVHMAGLNPDRRL